MAGVQVMTGMKIWRQIEYHRHGGIKVVDCETQPSRSGEGVVFKASMDHGMAREPSMLFMEDCTSTGIVCIAPGTVPENTTHFIIKGVSKKGNTAFVSPVAGPIEELLEKYKRIGEVHV